MKILVFGAGAIGTYVGGLLAHNGHKVVFVEQPDTVKGLQKQGLRLELPGSPMVELAPTSLAFASTLPAALEHGPFDIAVMALKSFDITAILEGMKANRELLPPVLCLSNGVDNEPEIGAVLGHGRVIAGTVTSSVGRYAAGSIVLERKRGVGIAAGHPVSIKVVEAMQAAGLNAQLFQDPIAMKWSKMLTNLPANATAAILGLTAEEVFAHPGVYQLERDMMLETLSVMHALGVPVIDLPGVPVRLLAVATYLPGFIARPLLKKAVGGGRGGKRPSFYIDLHSGRGMSEVAWLNGAVDRHGESVRVPTPVNRGLTRILLALTRGEIPVADYIHNPKKLLVEIQKEKQKENEEG